MRLRIDYFDQNDDFASQLPREGLVIGRPQACDSALSWYLVRLDEAVHYQQVAHTHVLLAARWAGHVIDGPEPTSVFILLVPPSQASVPDGFSCLHYPHVAWGMAAPAR